MPKIFCCYRRDDSQHQAGRIFDHLAQHFGKSEVFKDVDSIPIGRDFRRVLSEKVSQCDVLLALISDWWLSAGDQFGRRRIDDPEDFVRIEIESALQRNIPVVPVLVGMASVPRAEELPASLRDLAYRHGLPVRPDPDFHRDIERLVRGIGEVVTARKSVIATERSAPGPVLSSSPPTSMARQASTPAPTTTRIFCPKCGGPIAMPASVTDRVVCPTCQVRVVLKGTPRTERPRDREKAPVADPARKKMWLIIGSVSLAVLLLSGVVLAWILRRSDTAFTDELRYMPAKSRFIISVDVPAVLRSGPGSEILKSEAFKRLKKLSEKEFDGADFEQFLQEQTGLNVRDLRRLTLFGSPFPDGEQEESLVLVVKTTKAANFKLGKKIFGKDKDGKFPGMEEYKAGKFTISGNERLGYCVTDDATVVIGPLHSLKEVLRREHEPEISKSLQAAMSEANFANPIAMAYDLKEIVAEGARMSRNRRDKYNDIEKAKSAEEREERRFLNQLNKDFDAETAGLFNWFEGLAVKVTLGSRIEGKATLMLKSDAGRRATLSVQVETTTVLKIVQDAVEMSLAEQGRSKKISEFYENQRKKTGKEYDKKKDSE